MAKRSLSKEQTDSPPPDNGEDEQEEEYEIEAIIKYKANAFEDGSAGFYCKWVGYDSDQNSWVREEDAEHATELIKEFWRKKKEEDAKKLARRASASAAGTPKKARKKSPSPVEDDVMMEDATEKTSAKKARPSKSKVLEEDGDGQVILDMQEFENMTSWEKMIEHILTVERDPNTRKKGSPLFVYFSLKDNSRRRCTSTVAREKFPKKMLDFYESHLNWKEVDAA